MRSLTNGSPFTIVAFNERNDEKEKMQKIESNENLNASLSMFCVLCSRLLQYEMLESLPMNVNLSRWDVFFFFASFVPSTLFLQLSERKMVCCFQQLETLSSSLPGERRKKKSVCRSASFSSVYYSICEIARRVLIIEYCIGALGIKRHDTPK